MKLSPWLTVIVGAFGWCRKMLRKHLYLIFIALLVFLTASIIITWRVLYTNKKSTGLANRVRVEVYYETLCPDSYRFISTKLNNVYQTFGDEFMDVQLVPYGKAYESGDSNEWKINCQHGPTECYYNTIAACGIYSKENTELITNEQQLNFGVCMSNLRHGLNDPAVKECAVKSNLSWEKIIGCAKNANSSKIIQQKMGKLTQVHVPYLKKTLSNVPTVVINQVAYNGENLDLFSEVCKVLEGKNIDACT